MSIKNISDFDNQETIAKLLWKIRMIRIKLGADCLIMGALKLVFVILFLFYFYFFVWLRPRNPPGLIKAVKSLSLKKKV